MTNKADSSTVINDVSSQEEVFRMCSAGEELLRKGHHVMAAEKFKLALGLASNSSRAHAGLGRALYHSYLEASKCFDEDMKGGAAFLSNKDMERIIKLRTRIREEMETALRLGEQTPDFYADLGDYYLNVGETDKAKELFLKSIQINPQQPLANYGLGIYYEDLEKYIESIEYLKRAVTLLRSKPEVSFHLGQSLFRSDHKKESIRWYENAIRLKPSYSDALFNLGTALFSVGKREQAMNAYRQFLSLEPGSRDAVMLRNEFPELRE